MTDRWRRLARGIQSTLALRQWVPALAVLAPLLLVTALSAGWQLDDHFHRSRILGYGDAQPLQIFVPYDGIPAHTQAQMDAGTLPWWASRDPSLCWVRWQDGVYVPWTPPAEGMSVELPAPRGIF